MHRISNSHRIQFSAGVDAFRLKPSLNTTVRDLPFALAVHAGVSRGPDLQPLNTRTPEASPTCGLLTTSPTRTPSQLFVATCRFTPYA